MAAGQPPFQVRFRFIYNIYAEFINLNPDISRKCFPTADQLGMCKESLVFPE